MVAPIFLAALRADRPGPAGQRPAGANHQSSEGLHRPRSAKVLSHPNSPGLLRAALFVLYFAGLYADALPPRALRALVIVQLLLAGCLFWWPAVGIDAALPPRPGRPDLVPVLPSRSTPSWAWRSRASHARWLRGCRSSDLHAGGGRDVGRRRDHRAARDHRRSSWSGCAPTSERPSGTTRSGEVGRHRSWPTGGPPGRPPPGPQGVDQPRRTCSRRASGSRRSSGRTPVDRPTPCPAWPAGRCC